MRRCATPFARSAFLACVGAMVAHEIDAALRAEWRLLYGLRSLPDDVAAQLFVILHLPLVVAIGHVVSHPSERLREGARAAFSAFAILHAGLHWRLRDDPLSDFANPSSIACIAGSAIAAVAWFCAKAHSGRTIPTRTTGARRIAR
jgi:hypothetical protein